MLSRLRMILPDIPKQHAIGSILKAFDDKIELNRRMNQTLEAMAQAIFKSWFVDFNPVIDNDLKSGKPIPDSLAKRAAKRKQVLEKVRQNGYPPLPWKDGTTPFVTPKDMSSLTTPVILDAERHITEGRS